MGDHKRAVSPPLPPEPSYTPSTSRGQSSREASVASTSSHPPPPSQPAPKRAAVQRSRANSNVRPIIHQPQPIREAVDKAFDQSINQSSPTTAQLDPAFIAQVAEAVAKNLAAANVAGATPQQQTQYPPPPPPATQPPPQSPTQSSTASIPSRYTPPSPQRERDRVDIGSQGSVSPGSPGAPGSEVGSSFSRSSFASRFDPREGDTPRPAAQQVEPQTTLRRTNTNRSRDGVASDNGKHSRSASTSEPTRVFTRDRRDSQDSVGTANTSKARIKPKRAPSAVVELDEMTTLEKIWQPLFDQDGEATPRAGQFLRGLAQHIIGDYEPKDTLVITPAKMLRFLEETKADEEVYPWRTIFGGSITCASISMMYRRLLCQHHFIQQSNHEAPNLPALTPTGFEWFMTCLIQAHPDIEFERLSKAAMHMPISNADDSKERFPKELSRRLLPSNANSQAEQRLIASMAHEPAIQLKNSTAMPPPPPPPPTSSAPPRRTSFPERERMPYARTSQSNTVEDDDLGVPTIPLERERKPYSGREGVGKVYETDNDHDDRDRPNTSQYRPADNNIPMRPSRQNSIPGPASYSTTGASDPRNIPPPNNRARMSTTSAGAPPSLNTYSKSAGRRSPPSGNTFVRSEPVNVGDISSSQYASNIHPAAKIGQDIDDDTSSRRFTRRQAGAGDDDPRGKPIPSRSGPPTGYDSGYGSVGGPPSGPPLGTSSGRSRPSPAQGFDERRRSTFVNGPGTGGSDGWGSFAAGYPPPQGYGSAVGQ